MGARLSYVLGSSGGGSGSRDQVYKTQIHSWRLDATHCSFILWLLPFDSEILIYSLSTVPDWVVVCCKSCAYPQCYCLTGVFIIAKYLISREPTSSSRYRPTVNVVCTQMTFWDQSSRDPANPSPICVSMSSGGLKTGLSPGELNLSPFSPPDHTFSTQAAHRWVIAPMRMPS